MECSCVYVDVDDYATMLSDTRPIARKEHKCGECNQTIMPGEKYINEVAVDSNGLGVHKTCLDCSDIRHQFICDGFHWGMVLEDVSEHIFDSGGDISESMISELRPNARAWACSEIEKYWEWSK